MPSISLGKKVGPELAEMPMLQMATHVTELEAKVNQHLQKIGFSW